MNAAIARAPRLFVVVISLLFFGTSPMARTADESTPEPRVNVQPGQNSIEVSIAVPLHNLKQERELIYGGLKPHFHVLISNVSDQPQNIWEEWCSWGYSALSFEITDTKGKTWTAHKGPQDWLMNYPDYCTILPHESMVIDVYFADNTWEGFPRPKGEPLSFTMRAVFQIGSDEFTKKYSVWTGRVVSKTEKYTAYDPR